ncbi:MAG: DUF3047 domain-containing protein [Deltaproteobacteria bacterium]|nr:DUF3047 domain-containing protein [Deltaproteobacteria bacterium]
MTSVRVFWALVFVAMLPGGARADGGAPEKVSIPAGPRWKVLSRFAEGDSYYSVVDEGGAKLLRARYRPGRDTVILYAELDLPGHFRTLRWRWRVHKFPEGADEAIEGRRDSAGAVYVYFEATVRKYVLKYVWSVKHPPGFNFRGNNSRLFQKIHLVVKDGPPAATEEWRLASAPLDEDFHRYFGADVDVPSIVGLGVLTDGDGTNTEVIADYADFELER